MRRMIGATGTGVVLALCVGCSYYWHIDVEVEPPPEIVEVEGADALLVRVELVSSRYRVAAFSLWCGAEAGVIDTIGAGERGKAPSNCDVVVSVGTIDPDGFMAIEGRSAADVCAEVGTRSVELADWYADTAPMTDVAQGSAPCERYGEVVPVELELIAE